MEDSSPWLTHARLDSRLDEGLISDLRQQAAMAGTNSEQWIALWEDSARRSLAFNDLLELFGDTVAPDARVAATASLGTVLHRRDFADPGLELHGLPGTAVQWANALDAAGIGPGAGILTLSVAEIEDPAAALDWVGGINVRDEVKSEAVAEAFLRLLRADVSSAERWMRAEGLNLHLPTPERDLMVAQLVAALASETAPPSLTSEWLASIRSKTVHDQVLQRLDGLGLMVER